MIESVSSLFYLLHCSAHDRLNTMTFRSFRNIPHGLYPEADASETDIYNFASAHPAWIASATMDAERRCVYALPQHIPHGLHRMPNTSKPTLPGFASAHPARIASLFHNELYNLHTLPQHIPHGLHQQNRTDAMPQIHAICCELVDSFSDAAKAASALTIFPCSSTVKAIYIAIIDSLGQTIDRFFGANRTEKVC